MTNEIWEFVTIVFVSIIGLTTGLLLGLLIGEKGYKQFKKEIVIAFKQAFPVIIVGVITFGVIIVFKAFF